MEPIPSSNIEQDSERIKYAEIYLNGEDRRSELIAVVADIQGYSIEEIKDMLGATDAVAAQKVLDLGNKIINYALMAREFKFKDRPEVEKDMGSTAIDANWRNDAECRQEDPELFFPVGSSEGYKTAKAKLVCKKCKVTDACLEYVLNSTYTSGIWGGMSEAELRRLKKST